LAIFFLWDNYQLVVSYEGKVEVHPKIRTI
jgi:hypothetical protein